MRYPHPGVLFFLVVLPYGDIDSGDKRGYELREMEKRLNLSGGVMSFSLLYSYAPLCNE